MNEDPMFGYCFMCVHVPVKRSLPAAADDVKSKCYGCWFTEKKLNWELDPIHRAIAIQK